MKDKTAKTALGSLCRRKPFRAFLVELTSGDRFEVKHPEALYFRGELAIFLSPQSGYRLFDCDSLCQFLDLPPD